MRWVGAEEEEKQGVDGGGSWSGDCAAADGIYEMRWSILRQWITVATKV